MKCFITGGNGQLGHDLKRALSKEKDCTYFSPLKEEVDICDKEAVIKSIKQYQPDVIFHCAAYTAVDQAEEELERAFSINVTGTKNIVEAAQIVGAKVLYISTDYVFDGTKKEPYQITDAPHPQNMYGKSKWQGEEIVRKYSKHFIVRISWVFGVNGSNFIKTMLRLSETHSSLNVVCDQVGSPTYTSDLAPLLIEIAKTEKYGTYHATNEGFCSWAELATYLFEVAHKDVTVHAISTEAYQETLSKKQAYRPRNSRLSKQSLLEACFSPLPPWQDAVNRYLNELKEERNEM